MTLYILLVVQHLSFPQAILASYKESSWLSYLDQLCLDVSKAALAFVYFDAEIPLVKMA